MMKSENGFTLIECLFSMAIFAVAMLGVIGLQLNSIQSDEETRRKDMASQLLTSGEELVACSGYDSSTLYFDDESSFIGFLDGVKTRTITNVLMDCKGGRASLYLRHQQIGNVRNVYLVAAWDSIKTGRRQALSRMMVKPQNMLQ